MGNQLVGIAPSQIFPVEHYLTNLQDVKFDKSLGSTRFFKVARAKRQDGLVVVKVFAIHDVTLPIDEHKARVEEIRGKLATAFNCVPFQHVIVTEKAALLMREYIRFSLYDRISTRPFLSNIEKRWISFQILYAIHQCHKMGVCHGDIKLENICITSWNWVLLVDFASFKPTFVPEDNPADYSYFFDTSRRRTCYLAPERFVKGGIELAHNQNLLTQSVYSTDELRPAMDIFSAGCALLELWNEGHAPFDLAQLLMYKTGEYTPQKSLDALTDANLRDMIASMLDREPTKRLTAEAYLDQQRGIFFPEYFYSFLQGYMLFSVTPILTPDERIARLKADITRAIAYLKSTENKPDDDGLVILVTLVTCSIRGLVHCTSKLECLAILYELAEHSSDDIVLDRILPYITYFYNDQWSRVRASAIRTLTKSVQLVRKVPRSNANIFPEYILPSLITLSLDASTHVRCTVARHVAALADTAQKYLEQTKIETDAKSNYDVELQTLHEMFQQIVGNLLVDAETVVKRTLLESGITALCTFFGRVKANDVILSHMITFLNDKDNTELRFSFFQNIVGVARFIGYQISYILTPLLTQALTDPSEFVMAEGIIAMLTLTQLGLIKNPALCELVFETITIGLLHPGRHIRLATAGLVAAAAESLGPLDLMCKLAPVVNKYLKYSLLQITKTELILDALNPPVPRSVYDDLIKNYEMLEYLQRLKNTERAISMGESVSPVEAPSSLKNCHRKLTMEGMTATVERHILTMAAYLTKIGEVKRNVTKQSRGKIRIPRDYSHCMDLSEHVRKYTRKSNSATLPEATMNTEWQHMFGSRSDEEAASNGGLLDVPDLMASEDNSSSGTLHDMKSFVQYSVADCRHELRALETLQQNRYLSAVMNRERANVTATKHPHPPSKWRLTGTNVVHLTEHCAAVTKIEPLCNDVARKTCAMFASASLDGTVRLWDCKRLEDKNNFTYRSRQAYQLRAETGGVVQMASCHMSNALCVVGRNGALSMLRLERATVDLDTLLKRECECVDVCSLGENMVVASTVFGKVFGLDLRQPDPAWTLSISITRGIPTAMCVDNKRLSWLALATTRGEHTVWDLRFRLPIATLSHPSRIRVRKLACHPTEHSWLISSVQGNNEVSVWNMETQHREMVLWASVNAPLTQNGVYEGPKSSDYVTSLWPGIVDRQAFVLTAGTDFRVRFWDLKNVTKSYVAIHAANDKRRVTYDEEYVRNVKIFRETSEDVERNEQDAQKEQNSRPGPLPPSPAHRTPIRDMAICHADQCFLITGSSEGVIGVWK